MHHLLLGALGLACKRHNLAMTDCMCTVHKWHAGHCAQRCPPEAPMQDLQPVLPLRLLIQVVSAVQQKQLSSLPESLDMSCTSSMVSSQEHAVRLYSVLAIGPGSENMEASVGINDETEFICYLPTSVSSTSQFRDATTTNWRTFRRRRWHVRLRALNRHATHREVFLAVATHCVVRPFQQ